jgi:hypothetical protein
MSNSELQSGSEGDFERSQDNPEEVSTALADARKLSRFAAVAAMMMAVGCGANRHDGSRSDSAENTESRPQIQLQLNGGKTAGVSVFFGENKTYEFRLTSVADPGDVLTVDSKGGKAELLEGEFRNPTNGFKVEAFDEKGNAVPIGLTKTAAIYGPDRF